MAGKRKRTYWPRRHSDQDTPLDDPEILSSDSDRVAVLARKAKKQKEAEAVAQKEREEQLVETQLAQPSASVRERAVWAEPLWPTDYDYKPLFYENPNNILNFRILMQELSTRDLGEHPYIRAAFTAQASICNSGYMSKERMDACLNLVKSTSAADYKASSMGWDEQAKRAEMTDPAMWYILVHRLHFEVPEECIMKPDDSPGRIRALPDPCGPESFGGFLSFMYTKDDPPNETRDVVYVYELHLEEDLRGESLGEYLMDFVRKICMRTFTRKIMLTVFTRNVRARKFYERLGFVRDASSPPDRKVRGRVIEPEYLILSLSGISTYY